MLSCFEHENRFITSGSSMYLGKQLFRKVIPSESKLFAMKTRLCGHSETETYQNAKTCSIKKIEQPQS